MSIKAELQQSLQCGSFSRSTVGARIRELRQEKGLSQGDVERRTGLMRCYISRVENGYKSPSLRTVERFARALEVPLYRIFYTGKEPVCLERPGQHLSFANALIAGETQGTEASFLRKLSSLWSRTGDFEHEILFSMAKRMAARMGEGSNPNAQEVLHHPVRSLRRKPRKAGTHRIRRPESKRTDLATVLRAQP